MNKQLFAIVGTIALVIAGVTALTVSSGAEAQEKAPLILIIDMERMVAQSKAGQTIPDQAEDVREAVAKELEGVASKLEKDIESFQKNASLMSDEVRKKTEQDLTVRSQYGLPQQAKIADQAFRAAIQNARAKILVESQPIIEDIVKKRGATILLDRSAVMYAAVETDITEEVVSALDKKIKTVEVQKFTLAEIEKQLREAQTKAAQEQAKK